MPMFDGAVSVERMNIRKHQHKCSTVQIPPPYIVNVPRLHLLY